jgi:hypothetical protein
MSSRFHSQTYGQTETVYEILECYIQKSYHYKQANWEDMLPMAMGAYNNSLHFTVKMTPFLAICSYHCRTNWQSAEQS